MPGDRGLAVVLIGAICAIGLWIASARTVSHRAKAAIPASLPRSVTLPVMTSLPAPSIPRRFAEEAKSQLADELGLTPLD